MENQILYTEVDNSGNIMDPPVTLIKDNFEKVSSTWLADRTFVEVDNNIPTLNDNQFKSYSGFSQKDNGTISKDWEITTLSHDDAVKLWVHRYRGFLLKDSDWTQGVDSPLTDSQKSEWVTYRQALRDLPASVPNPLTSESQINWPTAPNEPEYQSGE